MRRIEENREILYVIRAVDVMMSSGVGLEAAMHTIGRGGYGVISEDFAAVLKRLQSGKSPGLEKELKKLMTNCETDGYRRLLNTLYNNLTQNTDVIESLKKLGSRMEEERSEAVKEYIEGLGGLPETMLSVGMLSPILIAVLALAPQIRTEGPPGDARVERADSALARHHGGRLGCDGLDHGLHWAQSAHDGPRIVR